MDFQTELSDSDAILFGIKSLVETYEPFTCKPPTDAFVNNEEYMNITELYFVVKNLRDLTDGQLYQACYNPSRIRSTGNGEDRPENSIQHTVTDTNRLVRQLNVLSNMLKSIRSYRDTRIAASSKKEESKPRLLKLCEAYKLTPAESDLLHLAVIMQGSNNSQVLNSLVELDYMRKIFKYQRLAGMSEVDMTFFCDHERTHMKEGIVTVEEENGFYFNLKLQQVAVQLMYGKKVRSDDLLKISQTSLEGILAAEFASNRQSVADTVAAAPTSQSATKATAKAAKRGRKRPRDLEVGDQVELDGHQQDEGDAPAAGSEEAPVATNVSGSPGTPVRKILRTADNSTGVHSAHGEDLSIIRITSRTSSFRRSAANTPSGGATAPHRQQSNGSKSSSLLRQSSLLSTATEDDGEDQDDNDSDNENDDDSDDGSEARGPTAMDEDDPEAKAHLVGAALEDNDAESSLKPYDNTNQLDYLEDGFQLISLLIKTNSAKLKDDLKKEGTSNANLWHDGATEAKFSNRELSAKIRLHEKRIGARLQKTKDAKLPLPRLETLMATFHANVFEKRLVLLLIGLTVSPIVRTLVDNMKNGHIVDTSISVGEALSILCQDFKSQLTHRRYFYQSSCLLANGVVSLYANRWREGGGDLTENRLALDRRILDWAVGLDSEIHELVQGSDLYDPVVQLEQVILPRGYIDRILSLCLAYDDYVLHQEFLLEQQQKDTATQGTSVATPAVFATAAAAASSATTASESSATEDTSLSVEKGAKTLSYGNSLVILLCGKSGTGKTMTVNAVAKELKKKVLLVDFQSLISRRGGSGGGGGEGDLDLKGLFREARMSNAVLFFDECETIFRGRHVGADRTLNSLLTEMERHTGIVFLATNRPHDIDEAMHRRITMVLEYREPTVAMRKLIWDNLLATMQTDAAMIAAEDVCDEALNPVDTAVTTVTSATATNAAAVPTESPSPSHDTSSLLLAPAPASAPAGIHLVGQIKRAKKRSVRSITVDSNVETSILAAKYQLTGGFIKNAVLSATLIAMSRDRTNPVIKQEDLIEGSTMQMRGNLSRNVFRIIPTDTGPRKTMKDLFVPDTTRLILQKIIQFENTRAKIYGTWNFTKSGGGGGEDAGQSNHHGDLQATIQQHACINLLAGSRGSGKNTVLRTVASELGGRKLKYVHVAELASDNIAASTETFHALVLDASILDAIIVIDGFEQILENTAGESGGAGASSSLHLVLSRLMDILYAFPGCIFLLAHIENPQNMELKRDFASRLFSFIRMTMSPYDIRASLWRSLIPKAAPLAADLDFTSLGRKFELFPVSIEAAIAYACSEVAARTKNPVVTQQDLVLAGEREVKKLRSNNFDIVSGLFN